MGGHRESVSTTMTALPRVLAPVYSPFLLLLFLFLLLALLLPSGSQAVENKGKEGETGTCTASMATDFRL